MFKKILRYCLSFGIFTALVFSIIFSTGCDYQTESYNKKDTSDFEKGATVKFDIIQFKNVLDEKTLKEMNLSGGYFLFMGGVSANSKETTETYNTYYMYLKNKNGAIYYAKIPADKVRIYEDAENPCLVAYDEFVSAIDVNKEDKWNEYEKFNLHIPKGTIIPRVNFNFDLSNVK